VEAEGGAVESSERTLVPLAPVPAVPTSAPDGPTELARLLAAAALGVALETQRRSTNATVAVVTRIRTPLGLLVRPALALTRGSVAVARHHLALDAWAARGLAGQRRAQEAAARALQTLIATLAATVLEVIDMDEVVARVDLERIVARIDPNQIAARIDLDAIIDRIDVDAIAARIDLDAIASRLDLDAIVASVDIDAILARVDLPGLTEQVIDEVDLGEIIRESSSTMASETVDALRVQGMRVDGLVSRVVDRILLREEPRQTGPPNREPPP
jgi:hypothetical protein